MFITEDFLLETEPARRLYHEHAAGMPIVDYHCHLPPQQIADDHRFRNLTELWLGDDHYKWRAMRWNGVPERFCSGDAGDWEKFEKWAATVPRLLRNPLYHWTHLELKRYFGIADVLLAPDTARRIWDAVNRRLPEPGFSCRGFIKRSNVEVVCTTDDPADSLAAHEAIAADPSFGIPVLPTWRSDKALAIEGGAAFNAWVDRLAEAADVAIGDFDSFLEALERRHEFFHRHGCRLSDHGIETVWAEEYGATEVESAFRRARAGRAPTPDQAAQFKSALLVEFGRMDCRRHWTQQYHLGALRNPNSRRFSALGADAGFDGISDRTVGRPLARLLDRLERDGRLPRTILYNLNPRDNLLLAVLAGSFQDGCVPGKVQYGSGWWFLDHQDGMEKQMDALSQVGLLSRFVGMVTDSRSFLSYARHEYFRRVLCNLLGKEMSQGLLPADLALVGGMVRDICYRNAASYFGFETVDRGGAEGGQDGR